MKTVSAVILFLCLAGQLASGEPANWYGLEKNTVRQILGEPRGAMGGETFAIWTYDRGEIVFRHGLVESYSLSDPEQSAEARRAYEERQEALRKARTEAEELHRLKGQLAWLELQQSERFQSANAAHRLTLMEGFRSVYPDVDISLEWALAWSEEDARRERQRALARAEQARQTAQQRSTHQGLRVSRTVGSGSGYWAPHPRWSHGGWSHGGQSVTIIQNGQIITVPPQYPCPQTSRNRPILSIRF